jgi:DNA-binding MarR family transcriptional regulator
MGKGPTGEAMRAWRAFLEAHARTVRVLEQELQADAGMALSWYDVLVQLSEAPGNARRMAELADAVLLSRSGLTRLIDRMAAAGLVRREPVEHDRRGTLVTLTDHGMDELRRAAPIHLGGVEQHFTRHLSEAEHTVLADLLERVRTSDRDASERDC